MNLMQIFFYYYLEHLKIQTRIVLNVEQTSFGSAKNLRKMNLKEKSGNDRNKTWKYEKLLEYRLISQQNEWKCTKKLWKVKKEWKKMLQSAIEDCGVILPQSSMGSMKKETWQNDETGKAYDGIILDGRNIFIVYRKKDC